MEGFFSINTAVVFYLEEMTVEQRFQENCRVKEEVGTRQTCLGVFKVFCAMLMISLKEQGVAIVRPKMSTAVQTVY